VLLSLVCGKFFDVPREKLLLNYLDILAQGMDFGRRSGAYASKRTDCAAGSGGQVAGRRDCPRSFEDLERIIDIESVVNDAPVQSNFFKPFPLNISLRCASIFGDKIFSVYQRVTLI
jgi:hypothetical protein